MDTNTTIAATLSLAWPCERRELVQRYADAGPATLPVPTLDAFVARKTATYMDRRAPRDLWDLAALAQLGPFVVNVAELFTALGPFRSLPSASTIPAAPEVSLSQRDLAHQTRLTITAAIALAVEPTPQAPADGGTTATPLVDLDLSNLGAVVAGGLAPLALLALLVLIRRRRAA